MEKLILLVYLILILVGLFYALKLIVNLIQPIVTY